MKTEVKSNKTKKSQKTKKTNKKQLPQKKKNLKKRRKIVAIVALIVMFLIITVLILFSDLFSIKQITVLNNSKISTEEIIDNSKLVIGNNMFKTFKTSIKNNIKENPYIEEVKVTKKLNGEIIIDVKERNSTYMLQNGSNYVYINNQGYILEITETPSALPIIKGCETQELIPGNRLNVQDLKKLSIVIQIMEAAKSNGVKDIITIIDISDENNFILDIPSEGKKVHFGDEKNINVKILWIVDLITREKGVEGEIIVNVPDIKKVYFREKV